MGSEKLKIAIIGAGNMATQLCYSFHTAGHPIVQVLARTPSSAEHLSQWIEESIISTYAELHTALDIILICVSDSAIPSVAYHLAQLSLDKKIIIAHTAGNPRMEIIEEHYTGPTGVMYPLQSVRKERPIDLRHTPILINGSDEQTIETLSTVAKYISDEVHWCDDSTRSGLHLPAVMVNNFVNYLYHAAHDFCEQQDLPYEHLRALILETAQRIADGELPRDVQTGPAIRRDWDTMAHHESTLADLPDQLELYQHISNLIMKMP